MNYQQWIDDVKKELNKKYKIRTLVESEFGLRIDFFNDFHYSIEKEGLEKLYYFSTSDVMRNNDGLHDICNNIEREYIKLLRRN